MSRALKHVVEVAENPTPPGASAHVLRTEDGIGLRLCHWSGSSGTVCVMPGRSEYFEKYFETIAGILGRGFAAVTFDWRGQGGSERMLPDRLKGHVDHVVQYRRDLETALDFMAAQNCPRPWYALAHSMGGAVVIDALAHGEARFDRAVACAPLIGLHGIRQDGWEASAVRLLNVIGLGGMYLPDSRSHAPSAYEPFNGNLLTSDEARYARNAAVLIAGPDLGVGAPTVGWMAAIFRLMQAMTVDGYGLSVKTPTLFINAGDDRIVSAAAAEALAARMRGASSVTITGARHEILMERDIYRDQFIAAFEAFCPPGQQATAMTTASGTAASAVEQL